MAPTSRANATGGCTRQRSEPVTASNAMTTEGWRTPTPGATSLAPTSTGRSEPSPSLHASDMMTSSNTQIRAACRDTGRPTKRRRASSHRRIKRLVVVAADRCSRVVEARPPSTSIGENHIELDSAPDSDVIDKLKCRRSSGPQRPQPHRQRFIALLRATFDPIGAGHRNCIDDAD